VSRDVTCPYCGVEFDICNDGGFGVDEGVLHHQECPECDKVFTFTTTIILSYQSYPAPCLNDESDHEWKIQDCYPSWMAKEECSHCGETRKPSDEVLEARYPGSMIDRLRYGMENFGYSTSSVGTKCGTCIRWAPPEYGNDINKPLKCNINPEYDSCSSYVPIGGNNGR